MHELEQGSLAEYFEPAPGPRLVHRRGRMVRGPDFDEEAASAASPDKIERNADLLKRIPALCGYAGRRAVQAFLAFLESSQA